MVDGRTDAKNIAEIGGNCQRQGMSRAICILKNPHGGGSKNGQNLSFSEKKRLA
jgi:hypothetical protein